MVQKGVYSVFSLLILYVVKIFGNRKELLSVSESKINDIIFLVADYYKCLEDITWLHRDMKFLFDC